jgi:hypothetical protein
MGWSVDATGSFSTVWWLMAAGPVLGILLLLFVNPERRGEEVERKRPVCYQEGIGGAINVRECEEAV